MAPDLTDEEVVAQTLEDLEPHMSDEEWSHPAALEPLQLYVQCTGVCERMTISQFRRYVRDKIKEAERAAPVQT